VTLTETLARFGKAGRRAVIGRRLERIYTLASSTGHLSRFVIFGSFITDKAEPNDIDIFLLMEDSFDVGQVSAEVVWCLIMPPHRIFWAQVCFGYGALPRSVVRKRRFHIGKLNAMVTNAALWR
jgi:hypothetical protein